jgi:hypothetical protein
VKILDYNNDIVFENRLAILLVRNHISFNWVSKGISVNDDDYERANQQIKWLKSHPDQSV